MKIRTTVDPALTPRIASAMARTGLHLDQLAVAGLEHILAEIEARPEPRIPRGDILIRPAGRADPARPA